MAGKNNIGVLRRLLRELYYVNFKDEKISKMPTYVYVMDQARSHQVSTKKLCKHEDELTHLADTYACLLQSVRRGNDLRNVYNKGERTVEESARLVGLELPKTHE